MTREKANEALVNALRKRGVASIVKATKLLVDAHRSRRPAPTGAVTLQSEAEAYSVQDAVFAELWSGARPAAWKVGGPSDCRGVCRNGGSRPTPVRGSRGGRPTRRNAVP